MIEEMERSKQCDNDNDAESTATGGGSHKNYHIFD